MEDGNEVVSDGDTTASLTGATKMCQQESILKNG